MGSSSFMEVLGPIGGPRLCIGVSALLGIEDPLIAVTWAGSGGAILFKMFSLDDVVIPFSDVGYSLNVNSGSKVEMESSIIWGTND